MIIKRLSNLVLVAVGGGMLILSFGTGCGGGGSSSSGSSSRSSDRVGNPPNVNVEVPGDEQNPIPDTRPEKPEEGPGG